MTKRCAKCHETKAASEFYASNLTSRGLYPRCKECVKAEQRAYRVEHREEVRAWPRAYARSEAARPAREKAKRKYLASLKGKAYMKRQSSLAWAPHPSRAQTPRALS